MSRHPYTHAADFVRHFGGPGLSRSSASQIIEAIAGVVGMTHEELSIKLSERFQEKNEEFTEEGVRKALREMRIND